jgi:hypothetical protein
MDMVHIDMFLLWIDSYHVLRSISYSTLALQIISIDYRLSEHTGASRLPCKLTGILNDAVHCTAVNNTHTHT